MRIITLRRRSELCDLNNFAKEHLFESMIILIKVECSAMIVLLEESVFALLCLVYYLFRVHPLPESALFFCHVTHFLQLGSLKYGGVLETKYF